MSTLKQTVNRLKSFDFEKAILKVYKDNDNIIIDLNTDSQLGEKGIDSTGSLLPGPYAPFTIASKQGQSGFGGITSHITLFGEGAFHNKFFVEASKFPIIINSSDAKRNELVDDWGEDLFGLTKESIQELKEQTIDEIQAANRKGIGI